MTKTRVVMIKGDAIYKGVEKEEALDKSVHHTVWPSEKVKTKVAYAIRIAGHFWIGIVEEEGAV